MAGEGIFVIFGLNGDLVRRKLLPALYRLYEGKFIDQNFKIVGITRRNTSKESLLKDIETAIKHEKDELKTNVIKLLSSNLSILNFDIGTDDYKPLKDAIDAAQIKSGKDLNILYYLSVPPEMFSTIVGKLGEVGLNIAPTKENDRRLLIEKPFGYDVKTAQKLIEDMSKTFDEKSIYRVDHYLAKETAQNILTFRLQNPLFRTVWNNMAVRHIMVTASESLTIEGRSNFYEKTGALRDLIQSHLLQLLALITMEEPAERTSEEIHRHKLALLESIKTVENVDKNTVRGQYDGYAEEVDNPDSNTETYAAIKLEIDNARWKGVPVLIRTGKAMAEKVTEINLVFKSRDFASKDTNVLTIRIQPDEGIVLSLLAKKPSFEQSTQRVQMEFFYGDSFEGRHADAYERVLIDAIRGDKTLFTTDEEVMASWRIVENIISDWKKTKQKPVLYKKGSWGPEEADKLAARSKAGWLTGHLKVRRKSL